MNRLGATSSIEAKIITSIQVPHLLLQTQDFKASQKKKSCIKVNTRELDKELCTRLSTLYILD